MIFTHINLPKDGWRRYMKRHATQMIRIDGPFEVQTREGVVQCADGFLAIDSGGWPYPISKEEQERMYVDMGEAK